MKLFALVLLIAIPAIACGQTVNNSNENAARQRFYRQQAESQVKSAMREANWNAAKKLSLLDKKDWPKSGESTAQLKELKKSQPEKIETLSFAVLSVMDSSSVLLTSSTGDVVWLRKYPTSDLVDGDNVRLLGYVVMRGTDQYETVAGAETTVRVLELLTPEEHAKEDSHRAELAALEVRRQQLDEHPEWTLKDGTKFRAKLETFQGNSARFILMGSQEPSVKRIVDFNQDDADKLRDLLAEHKKAERAAARARRK